jgi:hypothetical protein
MGKQAAEIRSDTIILRATPAQKQQIRQRAEQAGFRSMSEYILRCSLGTIDQDEQTGQNGHGDLGDRMDQLEQRMSTLERALEFDEELDELEPESANGGA